MATYIPFQCLLYLQNDRVMTLVADKLWLEGEKERKEEEERQRLEAEQVAQGKLLVTLT